MKADLHDGERHTPCPGPDRSALVELRQVVAGWQRVSEGKPSSQNSRTAEAEVAESGRVGGGVADDHMV
jgi:hypothetical protein